MMEVHLLKKPLTFGTDLVGEQSDALEVLALREINHVIDQLGAIALTSKVRVNDDILEQNDESAHCRADRKEHVHHPNDLVIGPDNKNAPATRLLEDGAQTALLLFAVRLEVFFELEQRHREIYQTRQILDRGGLDPGSLVQRLDRGGV